MLHFYTPSLTLLFSLLGMLDYRHADFLYPNNVSIKFSQKSANFFYPFHIFLAFSGSICLPILHPILSSVYSSKKSFILSFVLPFINISMYLSITQFVHCTDLFPVHSLGNLYTGMQKHDAR